MVLSRRTTPFVVLAVVLAAGALAPIVLTADAWQRLTALGLAGVVLAIWYRRRRASAATPLGGHIVLLKYPAIAFAVAPALGTQKMLRTTVTLVSLYLVLCIYESFDDPVLRASGRARRVAITELALLVSLIIATASFSGIALP